MGKGDKPRNCFSTGFKNNYDDINWGVSKSKPTLIKSGKVREIYQGKLYFFDDETLEIVTTDRVSAFDHILNQTIPGKGKILNKMSLRWFDMTYDIVDNHTIPSLWCRSAN